MSPAPVVHRTSQVFFDSLGIALTRRDADLGYPLLQFLDSIGSFLGEIEDLSRDTDEGPGWAVVMDVDEAPEPYLTWLAQFAGVQLPLGSASSTHRDRIRAREGWQRGTPEVIKAAVLRELTGTKKMRLIERDTSAYHFRVETYEIQTPDPSLVVDAIIEQKPGGLQFELVVLVGSSYQEIKDNFATYQDVKDEFATYDDMRSWVAP